jgi:hypothetical protein
MRRGLSTLVFRVWGFVLRNLAVKRRIEKMDCGAGRVDVRTS